MELRKHLHFDGVFTNLTVMNVSLNILYDIEMLYIENNNMAFEKYGRESI